MSTLAPPAAKPLAGLKVIESASYLTGPFASTMLADLGAEVIKVEPPGGDGFRSFGHKVDGWSALWINTNRGKRSIVLDLKQPADQEVMRGLLGMADAWIENWRPRVAESLGLGGATLDVLNPRLIRLSITGYGDSGPLAKAPAFDSLIQGLTGMAHLHGTPELPVVAPYWVVDKVVAVFAVQALLAALHQRERTGKGGAIALPMLDVMSYFNFPDVFQHRTFLADTMPRPAGFSPVVRTADGHLVVNLVNGAHLSRICAVLERPDIKAELRGLTDPQRIAERLYEHLNAILSTRPTAHWVELFTANDLPFSLVQSLDQHLSDPQVRHNGLYQEIATDAGPVRATRYPARFGDTVLPPAGPPPRLDQDGARLRAAVARQASGDAAG